MVIVCAVSSDNLVRIKLRQISHCSDTQKEVVLKSIIIKKYKMRQINHKYEI